MQPYNTGCPNKHTYTGRVCLPTRRTEEGGDKRRICRLNYKLAACAWRLGSTLYSRADVQGREMNESKTRVWVETLRGAGGIDM